VGITNAFNFLDGLDGLATGLVIISSLVFFIIALQTNQSYLGYLTVVLAGSALGFYPYNFHPARIFLGDSGSQFLGFCLASFAVMGKWSQHNVSVCLIVPVLVLGVFIFDITYISAARIIQGKITNLRTWIEYVGKDHLHHRLLNLGFTQLQTIFLIYLISLCLGLGAIAITGVLGHFILVLQAFAIFTILTVLMNIKKRDMGNT
jgi:UDP-GlcNAc:undecaprenyl-phosphate GlcNAc-1-phosphate transferase